MRNEVKLKLIGGGRGRRKYSQCSEYESTRSWNTGTTLFRYATGSTGLMNGRLTSNCVPDRRIAHRTKIPDRPVSSFQVKLVGPCPRCDWQITSQSTTQIEAHPSTCVPIDRSTIQSSVRSFIQLIRQGTGQQMSGQRCVASLPAIFTV